MKFKICEICGKKYFKKLEHSKKYWEKRRYCSKECKYVAMKTIMKGRKITWGDKISKIKQGHLVSNEARIKISKAKKGKNKSIEFIEKISGSNNVNWKGGLPKCEKCGKQLTNYTAIYCRECINILELNINRGIKNGNWKGGISTENDKTRQNKEIRKWKKLCLKRDNHTCQKYKIKNCKLVIHHKNSFANFKELRCDINNGITLSEKAHKEFHKIYGYKNNNAKQLEEYLKICQQQ